MKKKFAIPFLFFAFGFASAQTSYKDSLLRYINDYVKSHEVVREKDRKYLEFYPVNENYHIRAEFEKAINSPWFKMQTSGLLQPLYRVYGTVTFKINDTLVKLNIYQSQSLMQSEKYQEHLFIPFTDMTSGEETYSGGRYFDFNIGDIKNDELVIDFNKAYNPYCAYISNVYNCPIPPKENHLNVYIRAGEKKYAKSH